MDAGKLEEKVAVGLAAFSFGLGLYEVAAGEALDAALGMEGKGNLIRAYGVREITAGAGILATRPRPAFWVWARVAGDALDLATLALALRPDNPKRGNVWIAIGAVAGVTALDVWDALRLSSD